MVFEAFMVFVPFAHGFSMVPEIAAAVHGTGLDFKCFSFRPSCKLTCQKSSPVLILFRSPISWPLALP